MCKCNQNNVLAELFSDTPDICKEVDCCLKKRENKQSSHPVFTFVKPQYSSTSTCCEVKLINKYGSDTASFFNKYKNLMLECISTGNYSPLIAVIPGNSDLALYTQDGFPLFANSALVQLPLLSLSGFYNINLLDYTHLSSNTNCASADSSVSYCFKIMANYTSSIPSALSLAVAGNIIGIFTIHEPVAPKCKC